MSQPKRYICTRVLGMFEMQHAENGDWIHHSDYAALAAENERLRTQVGCDAIDRVHGMCCDSSCQVNKLTAENERLRKAGDELRDCIYSRLIQNIIADWNAAKKGGAK